MNGRWISQPEPPHRCAPPMKGFGDASGPDGLPGWVWECDCGLQWRIIPSLFSECYGVRAGLLGPAWRRVADESSEPTS